MLNRITYIIIEIYSFVQGRTVRRKSSQIRHIIFLFIKTKLRIRVLQLSINYIGIRRILCAKVRYLPKRMNILKLIKLNVIIILSTKLIILNNLFFHPIGSFIKQPETFLFKYGSITVNKRYKNLVILLNLPLHYLYILLKSNILQ